MGNYMLGTIRSDDDLFLVSGFPTLQKQNGCFNPARVISVASSLPNDVHTSP